MIDVSQAEQAAQVLAAAQTAAAAANAALAAQQSANMQAIITIVQATLATITTIVTGWLAYKASTFGITLKTVRDDVVQTKDAIAQTAASTEKIHVAVNSGRTAMENEISRLRDVVQTMSVDKAVLEEKGRR